VDVVGQGGHVGEEPVRADRAVGVAGLAADPGVVGPRLDHPAVVDVHVLVAEVGHARGDHRVGRLAHVPVGDAVVVDVPGVPAHGGRQGELVADDDLQRAIGAPVRALRLEHHGVLAALERGTTGDDAGGRVELHAFGQVGGEGDRSLARARDAIDERPPGATPVDERAVDPRLGPRLGREDRSRRPAFRRRTGGSDAEDCTNQRYGGPSCERVDHGRFSGGVLVFTPQAPPYYSLRTLHTNASNEGVPGEKGDAALFPCGKELRPLFPFGYSGSFRPDARASCRTAATTTSSTPGEKRPTSSVRPIVS